MPTLAGWLTGEQVPQEIIAETIQTMEVVLARHGGQPARTFYPGAGLVAFADPAYAMQHNDEPPVLDWVPDRRTLVYRRPLSGAHPLYYVTDWPAEGNLLFASEIQPLLALGMPRRINLAALDALLRYGFIPSPWTAFHNISIVPAGSILRWQRASTVVNASTDYRLDEPLPSPNADAALEQLHATLDTATANLLPPHDQLVALSGGEHASALAITMAAHYTHTPFTIATIDYRKKSSKLWRAAEQIAAAHTLPFLAITGVDQPEFWPATLASSETPAVTTRSLALHQLLHMATTETGARVALSAVGATTLGGGGIAAQTGAETDEWEPLRAYSQAASPTRTRSQAAPSLPWSQEAALALAGEEPWEQTLHARKLARRAAQFTDRRQGLYYLDLHLRLPDLLVHDMLQLAAQERLAIRSPFLNPHVIELLTRLPATLDDGTARETLIAALAQRLVGESAPSLPNATLAAPVASLLRPDASEVLQQVLSPAALQETGIFDPQTVAHMLQQPEVSRELLLVFTTQMFCQIFDAQPYQ